MRNAFDAADYRCAHRLISASPSMDFLCGGDDEPGPSMISNAPRMQGVAMSAWVADSDAASCQLCRRRFTTFCRRHHCRFVIDKLESFAARVPRVPTLTVRILTVGRACGMVVCHSCSSMRALVALPQQRGVKSSRVCDSCRNAHDRGLRESADRLSAEALVAKRVSAEIARRSSSERDFSASLQAMSSSESRAELRRAR